MSVVSAINPALNIKRPDGARKIPFSGEVKTPEDEQTFGKDADIKLDNQPQKDSLEVSKEVQKNSKEAKPNESKEKISSLTDDVKKEIEKEVKKQINEFKASKITPEEKSAESSNDKNSLSENMASTQKAGVAVLGYTLGAIKAVILGAVAGGVTLALKAVQEGIKKPKKKTAKWWGLGVGAVTLGVNMANTVLKVNAKKAQVSHSWGVDPSSGK